MANTETKERPTGQRAPETAPNANVPAEQKRKHPLVAFKDYADARMETLGNALPPHIPQAAFMSVVLTALQKKPELLKCTQQSLWNACIDAANVGLLPDGIEGAIAPYGQNEKGQRIAEIATFMPMIGGYRKLAYEGGLIASWEVHVVRQRDHFDFALGDDAYIEHKPYFGAENPGDVVGAYSIAKLKDGSVLRDVMGLFDLNRIKAKSKASKGPWSDATFEPEMHRKTMGRRHYKQLPKTPALSRLIERENAEFDIDGKSDEAIEARQVRRLTTTRDAFDQFSRGGPVIDHAAHHQPHIDGDDEFAEDEPSQAEASAADQPAQTGRPDPISSGPQPDQQQAAPADEAKSPEPVEQSAGEDVRRWPNGEVPSNAEEYEFYVETKLSDFTRETAGKIPDWWKSAEEKKLREACKVSKELHDELRGKASSRKNELSK